MNSTALQAELRAVRANLLATQTALRSARALLFAALEQLQARGAFDPATLDLPAEALKSVKLAEWLKKVTDVDKPNS